MGVFWWGTFLPPKDAENRWLSCTGNRGMFAESSKVYRKIMALNEKSTRPVRMAVQDSCQHAVGR